MMRAIGLSGFAGSGKTAAALYIQEKYGFERRHIAEPLRAMLAVLMRANGISDEMIDRYLVGDLKDGVVIPEFGRTSREMQISIGTEWGREHVGPNLWVDTWHRGIKPGDKVMNDSVRFPNEEAAIQGDEGITLLIRRDGTGPAAFKWGWFGKALYRATGLMWGVHDSERVDRLNPTFVIENDGTLEDLYREIDMAMQDTRGVVLIGQDPAEAAALLAITYAAFAR
ncbi:hypothetical protein [Methylobacterium sp. WL120]|uniref:hypothetical protein n=1 Tax=Methylobacterium sp. WL120 TaxID=2603887 RepID=UPI0011C8B4D7|nr:hypothetical protein [Methylobacterium sp. WL120]TXM68311.1 hypothetical protein FV229_08045 [Methylobacterium sp. WL120]